MMMWWVRRAGWSGDVSITLVRVVKTSKSVAYAYKVSDPTKHERRIPLHCLRDEMPGEYGKASDFDQRKVPYHPQVVEREVTVLLRDGRPIAVLDKANMDQMTDREGYMKAWRDLADDSEVTTLYEVK